MVGSVRRLGLAPSLIAAALSCWLSKRVEPEAVSLSSASRSSGLSLGRRSEGRWNERHKAFDLFEVDISILPESAALPEG